MTDAFRSSQYIEYRDAAAAILAREPGEAAAKAFGLDAGEPLDDPTPVYAFLEAQGLQVATTSVLAWTGIGTLAPQALLGLPVGVGAVAVPGWREGTAVVVDRPGTGLVVVEGDRVRPRVVPQPAADDYLRVVDVDPDGLAGARVALPERHVAPLREDILARVRIGAAGELLGLCGRLLEDVVAYARVRRQFGRAISGFQVVQHLLGWAATERHQLASMYDLAVEQAALGSVDPRLAIAVKALAGRVAHAVAQTAVQVTGGISFTWEYSLNRPHQRALALDQFAGASADLIVAMGREARAERALPELFGLVGPRGAA